jgi:OmcA/MtrC family decaheme c-type cytochrome
MGETTLNWEHTGNVEIQIRTPGNPDGKVFARGGRTGSAATGKWVADGTVFDLYDAGTMELVQSVTVNATVLCCVSNAPGSFRGVAGVEHTNWMDRLSRKTCGSCHDDIDFEAGEGHIAQQSDDDCHFCHKPVTGVEFDKSVAGAHTTLYKSAQLPGVLVKFIKVTNTNPGNKPTVTFSVGGKNGHYNPADMNRVRLVINGPNDDFSFYASETVGDKAVAQGGNWNYRFETPLPMDAAGSYTVSMEGRVDADVDYGDEVDGERDYAQNPMMAFAVTDDSATPRRMIVDNAKCESCHLSLSLHGGNRTEVQYCTSCHRPDLVDIADIPESVNMKWMIHKIHRGADLENGYVVIRSRGTYDFSEIEFTGDLRNCDACHVNDSEQLPMAAGLLPQITPNFWWDPIEPAAAACLSCHDGDDASAHAYSNTTFFGESCSTCHGVGKSSSVDKVHAR